MLESEIQRKMISLLKAEGWFVWKNMQISVNGFPDLTAVKGGRHIHLEVKTSNGRLRKIQLHTLKKLENMGAEAYVVRTIDDVKEIINA